MWTVPWWKLLAARRLCKRLNDAFSAEPSCDEVKR